MSKKWSVYKHTNKINGKVYIGITSKNPEDRWGKDGRMYLRKSNGVYKQPYFANAILKYTWDGFIHEILFSNLTEKDAKKKEIELIALYKSNCCRYDSPSYGYNMTDGGDGSAGKEWTQESREKVRQTLIGHTVSDETRMKISKSQTGKKHPISEEAKLRMIYSKSCKQVYCIELDVIFESVTVAAKAIGIDRSCISNACRGKQKTAGGYTWMYYSDYLIMKKCNI